MILRSAIETIEFAKDFAKNLKGGEVLALSGDLGSGKTTFLKGLAEGLKVVDTINSPTFVILKKYPGKIANKKIEFVHIDAYRLETAEDTESIGIIDYLNHDDVVVAIEWAEKIREILPKNTININFKYLDEKSREIEIKK